MAIPINSILNFFLTGKRPTQQQFAESWTSFWHKDENIPVAKIDGLGAMFVPINNHFNDINAHENLIIKSRFIPFGNFQVFKASGNNQPNVLQVGDYGSGLLNDYETFIPFGIYLGGNAQISSSWAVSPSQNNSGIITAPAIAGTGNTIVKFDQIRYHGPTDQIDNMSFSLDTTPNIHKNGCVQVYDVNGMTGKTTSFPTELQKWVNSNGVDFNPEKNNIIYMDYVNGKINFNITNRDKPDLTAPILLSAVIQNANPSNIVLTYNEALTVSPLPSNTDFGLNLSKTVTAISISGSVVTLTVNTPYVTGNLPTISYTSGTNKIKDLAGNNAVNLVNQGIINNIGTIASDDFSGVNITELAGRRTSFPIPGFLWLKGGGGTGTLGIVNNSLKNTGAILDMNNIYYFDIGTRNVDISLTYKAVGAAGNANLEFARVSDGNRYYLRNDMQLRKVVGGINTLVSAIGGGLINGDTVRCVLNNTTIQVYKNGNQVYTGASDPSVTGTNIGIYVYQDDVVDFDNLIIT